MECSEYWSAAEQCECYMERAYRLMDLVDSCERLLNQLVDMSSNYLKIAIEQDREISTPAADFENGEARGT